MEDGISSANRTTTQDSGKKANKEKEIG